jgi:nitric oxide reductase activation protein
MMMAQGDILHRVGVPFIMLGHSAARAQIKNFSGYSSGDYWTYALMIKDLAEGWGPTTKNRLAALGPIAENLDGHTLEYCRKLADKSNATDVVIIYYTDGEMPAANATEEREVLVREVKTCKRKGYHLLGVGINTDSPKRYGMNTVRVESDADIKLVVEQLEKELTQ